MSIRVRLGAGTGVELLMAAAAVADPDWRAVFHHGPTSYDAVVAAGGRGLARDMTRFGRYGWINLAGPLTAQRGAWSTDALRGWVDAAEPDEVVRVLTGARRRQLRSRLDDTTIAAAVAGGDRAARTRWRHTLDDTLLQVAPWLLATPPETVRATLLDVIDRLPAPARATPLPRIRERLAEVGPEALLAEVAPGVTYRTGVLDDVVLVTSPAVSPILVVVDEVDRTVILHPPLADGAPDDAGARLRELGRAVGDDTRIRLLHTLRLRPSTLPQLCDELASPRTTLLHHLALLRSAGLVSIEVIDGEANVYRLRPEGFEAMARAATAFPYS
ncbi:DNA-binding transcriptional ArsR family regulator [Nocardioides sp. BE266]|uniref:helix-turn-helix domain-containing protein n=1 Tax=Nocardioides sp. BE266 TaxID=2817725 RepID=UPI00285E32E4|nr:helix-turn-helix domain-containing protein [Nocardioides sp. BE266]MDR7254477.1 DNA-binding transcriptional ArsR family regulator [Nocardioides sp. BE266]